MSGGDPLARLDATDQAELVRRGEATPRELVDAALERVERIGDRIGAVPIRLDALARDRVADLELGGIGASGAFCGVPFLMKDVGARQAGQPYYAANRALRDADHRAPADTPLGARFRGLGLVTIGKSNTPEFGLQSHTWPLVYGPARNPWDLGRSAGGSSGGACAAVAAGLVPVAHASDGAGSIRIPSAWCGLVGLKPTRDRVVWRHTGQSRPDVEFVVARSLRDTAAMLDACDARGAGQAGEPSCVSALDEPPKPLRVRVCVEAPDGSAVHAACTAAARTTAASLAALGHAVDDGAPPSFAEYADRCLYGAVLGTVEYRMCIADLAERLGREVGQDDVEPYLWELAQISVDASAAEVDAALAWNRRWVTSTRDWFRGVDVLVTPTVGVPAPTLDELDPARIAPLEMLERMAPHMAFTEPWNATGQPAISLPLGRTDTGLPVGVQLIAAPGADRMLLSLAATLMPPGAPAAAPPTHA